MFSKFLRLFVKYTAKFWGWLRSLPQSRNMNHKNRAVPVLTRRQVLGCNFVYKCPLEWQSLTPTENDAIRYCSTCEQAVYLAMSDQHLQQLRREQRCIAIDVPQSIPTMGIVAIDRTDYPVPREPKRKKRQ